MLYQKLFQWVFRHFDPELMHHLGFAVLRLFAVFLQPVQSNPKELFGVIFENRLGIAAGFDKNAKGIQALHRLGFGHVEIGTVTPLPQPGNPKPRMFRIWEKRAIINRMGFNNDGAEIVAKRLIRARRLSNLPVIGVNIGKNKATAAELAASDYQNCARLLAPHADYLAVNVSSPNTPGLRDLQQIDSLRVILTAVLEECNGKPVLVKIAPDLADADVLAIGELANQLGLAGVIAANTTISRAAVTGLEHADEVGGLSGPMLADRSLAMLVMLRKVLAPGKVVISVGGLTTPAEFQARLAAGADLVQAYTGFIFGGPLWPRRVQRTD